MTKTKPVDAMTKIVAILEPLSSDERLRTVRAAMVLLGESSSNDTFQNTTELVGTPDVTSSDIPSRAQTWMKQNDVTNDEVQQIFHISDGTVDVLVQSPGKNKKEQTLNMYVLTGIGQLLATGEPLFEDKVARENCRTAGCYDTGNHSFYMKGKGNLFASAKDKKWTLTSPGLKKGAEIIKEIVKK